MFVLKRNGMLEEVSYDKVTRRIKYLCMGLLSDGSSIGTSLNINYSQVAQKVISMIVNGISTTDLDNYAANHCADMITHTYEYGILGGRIAVSNHQKNTLSCFSDTMRFLYENKADNGRANPLISRKLYKSVTVNRKELDNMIDYSRDYRFDYFGFSTLLDSCLIKGNNTMERPQHLYMRLAVAMCGEDLAKIKESYDLLSLGFYTHASPTMYNAGTPYQQLSSCFLLGISDTMDGDGGIPDCWKACAKISKRAGGIGIGITPIRGRDSEILGTNGRSSGLMPLLKILNGISKYVNQGGRRPGAFAIDIEIWHCDVKKIIDAKKNTGAEDDRARDLFYGLMIPDIFMRRIILAQSLIDSGEYNDEIDEDTGLNSPKFNAPMWSLMCPNECPGLYTTYGEEFEKLYTSYEKQHKYKSQVKIYDMWKDIFAAQKETGVPYMLYKDNINRCNNQANLGVIRNSNLCCEIVEYSDETEYAVCNLASISLPNFVVSDPASGPINRYFKGNRPNTYFDMDHLRRVAYVAHRNLNHIIDINEYPVIQAKKSNLRHRPVGLGVQGLADVFMLLGYPYESLEARELNKQIFETIYYGSMTSSVDIAEEREYRMLCLRDAYHDGVFCYEDEYSLTPTVFEDLELSDNLAHVFCDLEELKPIKEELERDKYHGAYASFIGSPLSEGKFQFDLWGDKPSPILAWEWEDLRKKVLLHGARNSLTTCVMPTASTAQILGNTECIEPFKYNLYTRRVQSGEFFVLNSHLQRDLENNSLWMESIQNQLKKYRGSVQELKFPEETPAETIMFLKDMYKTAYEVSKKVTLEMSRDRSPFIDQTQSLNMFVASPTNAILHSIFVTGWKLGLKTGMYYLRREAVAKAIQFTVCESCSG